MKLSDLDKLLDNQGMKSAPPDFTANVMKAVRGLEIQKNVPLYHNKVGLRLIAAALITLLINFSPLLHRVTRLTQANVSNDLHWFYMENIPETIDYYTLKVSNLLTRPLHLLDQSLNKEE